MQQLALGRQLAVGQQGVGAQHAPSSSKSTPWKGKGKGQGKVKGKAAFKGEGAEGKGKAKVSQRQSIIAAGVDAQRVWAAGMLLLAVSAPKNQLAK